MKLTDRLIGLVRFESALALVLAVVPVALRLAETRGSISVYHDMADPRWFFVPLSAAAMMLVGNGLVRHESHGYNATLGLLLIGVVLFDHDDGSAIPHFVCAASFFVLSLLYVALLVPHYVRTLRGAAGPSLLVAVGTAVLIVAALAAAAVVGDEPTFWLEAVGVWIIATHYVYHVWWEVRRPDDDTEPMKVLDQVAPRLAVPAPVVRVAHVRVAAVEPTPPDRRGEDRGSFLSLLSRRGRRDRRDRAGPPRRGRARGCRRSRARRRTRGAS